MRCFSAMLQTVVTYVFLCLTILTRGQSLNKMVLTNDDGWAVNLIRATNDDLKTAGLDVVLSCPADNRSGTGSSTATPTPLTTPCEFNTCPAGSPAVGFNASDPRLNYVHAFPVDAARFGIQTLAPRFFNGQPADFVVSGPNVGLNTGSTVLISGTVGAACEAALEGIPSTAFSATTTSQVSYTTLESDPNSSISIAANIYAALTTKFTQALLSGGPAPILPRNITLNVNMPDTTGSNACNTVDKFKFVLTRIFSNSTAVDVATCGTSHLPLEATVVGSTVGCFVSVSVMNATVKSDVDAATQRFVLNRLDGFLECFTG